MRDVVEHRDLFDLRVVRQLVKDIGVAKTREYFSCLDEEVARRTDRILVAFKELDLNLLAAEIHALKSCTQSAGATLLGHKLESIEKLAKAGDHSALAQIGDLLELIKLTCEACKELDLASLA